jgi:hypothetical protein
LRISCHGALEARSIAVTFRQKPAATGIKQRMIFSHSGHEIRSCVPLGGLNFFNA